MCFRSVFLCPFAHLTAAYWSDKKTRLSTRLLLIKTKWGFGCSLVETYYWEHICWHARDEHSFFFFPSQTFFCRENGLGARPNVLYAGKTLYIYYIYIYTYIYIYFVPSFIGVCLIQEMCRCCHDKSDKTWLIWLHSYFPILPARYSNTGVTYLQLIMEITAHRDTLIRCSLGSFPHCSFKVCWRTLVHSGVSFEVAYLVNFCITIGSSPLSNGWHALRCMRKPMPYWHRFSVPNPSEETVTFD